MRGVRSLVSYYNSIVGGFGHLTGSNPATIRTESGSIVERVHMSMHEKSGGQEKGVSTYIPLRSVHFTSKTSCVHASSYP